MGTIKLNNGTRKNSVIGQLVRVDPNDPKNFIAVNINEIGVIGIVKEVRGPGNPTLIHLINHPPSYDEISGLPDLTSFGTPPNYTKFEEDGTMVAMGNATGWLDSMVSPTVFRTGGTSLTLAELVSGIYAHRYDVTDTIHFDLQLNHNMRINTPLYPHIHLVNKDAIVGAADVTFTFTYSWANIDSAFPGVLSQSNKVVSFADAAALTHKVLVFDSITPVAGQGGISSIMIGALTRVNAGYATNNIFHLGFDVHYEADMLGSREEYIK